MAPSKSQQASVDPTLEILRSIDGSLRLLVQLQLGPRYESLIIENKMQKLYQATGKKSVVVLAKEFGMSTGKISMLWQTWEQAGLLRKNGLQYEQTV